jgi:hypothetical protein
MTNSSELDDKCLLTTNTMRLLNKLTELINNSLTYFPSFHANYVLRRSVLCQKIINGSVGET